MLIQRKTESDRQRERERERDKTYLELRYIHQSICVPVLTDFERALWIKALVRIVVFIFSDVHITHVCNDLGQ